MQQFSTHDQEELAIDSQRAFFATSSLRHLYIPTLQQTGVGDRTTKEVDVLLLKNMVYTLTFLDRINKKKITQYLRVEISHTFNLA